MPQWPDWWSWELRLSAHLLRRMVDRDFTETDLRLMMADARDYHWDVAPGRWIIHGRLAGRSWEVIVEPLPEERVLFVVTAYPVD